MSIELKLKSFLSNVNYFNKNKRIKKLIFSFIKYDALRELTKKVLMTNGNGYTITSDCYHNVIKKNKQRIILFKATNC